MTNVVKNWFRKRRDAKNAKSAKTPAFSPVLPIPKLAKERAGRLTPTPSCESLIISANAVTAKSDFFTKLPLEIRRSILIEAFGHQVVHMDLMFDHPPLPHDGDSPSGQNRGDTIAHCNVNVDLLKYAGSTHIHPRIDESQPKRWLWSGSVCHRNPPILLPPGDQVQPGQDLCRFGQTNFNRMCHTWPGDFPSKCLIGIMGWLCSCRQAYIEGIDVLYCTNTIHTASKELLMDIKDLLLPQRLSSITSVELLWEFQPFPKFRKKGPEPPLSDFSSFYSFLEKVPSMFPNARHLHVSLLGILQPTKVINGTTEWDTEVGTLDEAYLKPVDTMARTLGPHVQDFTIAIPSSIYRGLRIRATDAGDQVEQTCYGSKQERFWRPLADSANRSGYWVRLGHKDIAMPIICTMGTGGYSDFFPDEDRILYIY